MFRLEAHLELIVTGVASAHRPQVQLRGYDSDKVSVTGEFISMTPVSVGDIVGFCPVHRDLYLRKVKSVRAPDLSTSKNWARTAGPIIQDFLESVYESHRKTRASSAAGDSAKALVGEAARLFEEFVRTGNMSERLKRLGAKAATRYDLSPETLKQLLINSAAADLFSLQGALNYERLGDGAAQVLSALQIGQKYDPADYLKISKHSTPDILLPKFGAVGDIKSGAFKEEYLLTVAGYALGYESYSKENIDIGVLYLVETGDDTIGWSRSRFFWITDDLRRRFLDRRDHALSILAEGGTEPARLSSETDKETHCARCAFKEICFPEGS